MLPASFTQNQKSDIKANLDIRSRECSCFTAQATPFFFAVHPQSLFSGSFFPARLHAGLKSTYKSLLHSFSHLLWHTANQTLSLPTHPMLPPDRLALRAPADFKIPKKFPQYELLAVLAADTPRTGGHESKLKVHTPRRFMRWKTPGFRDQLQGLRP